MLRTVLRVIVLHLYLPLKGAEQVAQLDTIAQLLRGYENDYVLIGGGWSFGAGYKCTGDEDEPIFAPEYLRSRLLERGVPADRIIIAPRVSIRHWLLNVVSTWGETKQMHRLLRKVKSWYTVRHVQPVFVGMPTHMVRATHLWRWYNGLMRCIGRGVPMRITQTVPIGIEPEAEWLAGEPVRNRIAKLDPFGLGPAFLIHLLRRLQARRACPR